MSTVLLNGNPIGVGGRFPRTGDIAHSFMLVDQDLKDISLSQFSGQRKVVVVVPSLDTTLGINIARRLDLLADHWDNAVVLVVSVDTPYAQARIKAAENFRNVRLLSTLRGRDFHKDYGVMITDVPLSGLMSTAAISMDEDDKVLYAELCREINSEPNYQEISKSLAPPEE
jgi:thioredoxin-dependent peroxiredoxin